MHRVTFVQVSRSLVCVSSFIQHACIPGSGVPTSVSLRIWGAGKVTQIATFLDGNSDTPAASFAAFESFRLHEVKMVSVRREVA